MILSARNVLVVRTHSPFLHTILVQNLLRANVALSKETVVLIQHMALVYSTAKAVNESDLSKVITDVWENAAQLNDKPLQLSYSAQRVTDFLKQEYTTLESFCRPM